MQLLNCCNVSVLAGVLTDSRAERVIAHVQHGKGELLGVLGNHRADFGSSHGEMHFPGDEGSIVAGIDGVAVFRRAGLEHGADRIVSGYLFESDNCRLYQRPIDLRAIRVLGKIALGLRETFHEAGFHGLSLFLRRELLRQLNDSARVGDYLSRFDTRDLVEEPPAARVHEHGMTLHLQQFQGDHLFIARQVALGVRGKETLAAFLRTVENHTHIFIARFPDIAQEG